MQKLKTMNQNIKNESFGTAKTAIKHYKNSHSVLQRAFLRQAPRPNEKSFGASGSQVTPDSSARPAGPGQFLVYRKYTLPLRNSFKGRFRYTRQYTAF
jgi:hypothetical protein